MKSIKFWSIMIMLVMVLCTSITFSSCSKNDGEITTDEEQSVMVGKWKYSFGDESYCLLTFKPDGTGTYFEYDDGEIDAENEPFYWSYEENGSILTLLWIEDGQVEDKDVVRLTWINKKTFMADLMDNDSVWVKQ